MKRKTSMKPLPKPDPEAQRRIENLLRQDLLVEVPREEWPTASRFRPLGVWCNKKYLVFEAPPQESGSLGTLRHLMVRPHRGQHPGWVELYKIKNEIIGESAWAMEVHPAFCHMVDDADMYHLWVVTDPALVPRTSI